MKSLAALLALILGSSLHGQIAGTFESFTDEENAESWYLYDFGTPDQYYVPSWTLPESTDPEIYAEFFEDSGISFLADNTSSNGAFVGNYVTGGVESLATDVYVEVPENLDFFQYYLISGGTFYFSNVLEVDDPGYSSLEYSLKSDLWYTQNAENDYIETELTEAVLSDIEEVGIDFFPLSAAADGNKVGIDNFILLADLREAVPEVVVGEDEGTLTFQAVPGLEYTVEKSSNLKAKSWSEVEPPFELSGPYSYLFTPGPRSFFRVKQVELYYEVPKVSP